MGSSRRLIRDIHSSEITPEHLYTTFITRRRFVRDVSAVAASGLLFGACASPEDAAPGAVAPGVAPTGGAPGSGGATRDTAGVSTRGPTTGSPEAPVAAADGRASVTLAGPDAAPRALASVDELGDGLNDYEAITHYNNYYEFTTDKERVAPMAEGFPTTPWAVQVGGLVNRPRTFAMEDLLKFPQSERVYRLRCVEGWSMVIPWVGFPLAALLEAVEPTAAAQFVRFETILDPKRMPGQNGGPYRWPYVEGLRLDEAYNDLAILATGLYGKVLTPQNGAPVRLVVPWKYGFKSIKAIVKIDLVDTMPTSLWMAAAPNEYGFYANVNPDVPHPRWSQSSERRIGELRRRKTLPFNGYADQVAHLYAGMDLRRDF